MVAILTPTDRATFKSCRRAWDLGAPGRRNLEPLVVVDSLNVDRALRDALAVYYFPGMWDWTRAVVIPLVARALEKAVTAERGRLGPEPPPNFELLANAARLLLRAYVDWAPGVERLAPVLIEVDYAAELPDPEDPHSGLFVASADYVRYQGRLDMLAVDEHDAYWVVRHRVVNEWTTQETLVRDEEAVAACWAWERFYIGMEIAGTIHNEMRLPARTALEGDPGSKPTAVSGPERGGVAQHEGSGGGRSIPQHRRLYARAAEPENPERITRQTGPWFRRTWIRRSRAEIAQAGRQLATEARQIFDPGVAVYPSPSESGCRRCSFVAPCLALYEGRDSEAEAILASSYCSRPPEDAVEGRLGGVTWSTGRGAAPPQFPSRATDE